MFMKKRLFLAIVLGALLMSITAYAEPAPAPQIYETSFSPDEVTNAVYDNNKLKSISIFYITKDWDGYRLYAEAATMDGLYCEKYSGYATEIGTVGEYGLVFLFTSDHDSAATDYVGGDLLVAWRNFEGIDYPILVGYDQYADYLFEGEYSFSRPFSQ